MPIYEYKCEHCQETFEVLQKFSDEPLTECILCSNGPVKKLISASSFILKGEGFYVNDYKKKETAPEKSNGSSSSASTASDATPSASDSKTASASDSKTASTDKAKSSA